MRIHANSLRALVGAGVLAGGLAFAQSHYGSEDQNTKDPGTSEPGGTSLPGDNAQPGETSKPSDSHMKYDQSMLPPNVSPGWRVRICSEKTKANAIRFLVSMPESKSKESEKGTGGTGMSGTAEPELAEWKHGDNTEIKLPESFSRAEKIRLEAMPDQKDKKASVCVLFNDHVVKHLNFDDHEVTTMKKTEEGECGC